MEIKYIWNVTLKDSNDRINDLEFYAAFLRKCGIDISVNSDEFRGLSKSLALLKKDFPDSFAMKSNAEWQVSMTKILLKWRNEYKPINLDEDKSQLQIKVEDIIVRYARYEDKRIFLLVINVFREDSVAKKVNIFQDQRELAQLLEKHFHTESEYNFQVGIKFEEFSERLRLLNPIPVIIGDEEQEIHEIINWTCIDDEPEVKRYYLESYLSEDEKQYYNSAYGNEQDSLNNYVRAWRVVYKVKSSIIGDSVVHGTNKIERSPFYDKIHTEFVLFQRGQDYEKKYTNIFQSIRLLKSVVELVSDQWSSLRAYYFATKRFSILPSKQSKLFFYLLEVNSLIMALMAKIKFDLDNSRQSMIEAFERPMVNIKQSNCSEAESRYFFELSAKCQTAFTVYNEKKDAVENAYNLITQNISELRADFDSNANYILQNLLFLLSITLVVWGVVTLLLDKLSDKISNSMELLTNLLQGWPYLSVVAFSLFGFLLILWVVGLLWLRLSTGFVEVTDKRIISDWVNRSPQEHNDIDDKFNYNNDFKPTYKEFVDRINEAFRLTSFLMHAVGLNKIKPSDAIVFMKKIRAKTGME